MPKGIPRDLWREEGALEEFMELCERAKKPSVDWTKFRKYDAKDRFKEIPNATLSAKFRIMRLTMAGICWNCGKRKAKNDNGLCHTCVRYFTEARIVSSQKIEANQRQVEDA